MNNNKWEPWVWYPEIWPTKAAFFTYLRGSLRKAVWNLSPIKISFKNEVCSKPPEGYTGKAKSGAYCALTGEWEGKSKLQVDHCEGNISLQDEEDIITFLKHLVPPPGSLQLVTPEAHKVKSYAEKQGISFEEALIEKRTIEIMKTKTEKIWLIERGVMPESSAAKRRQQVKLYLQQQEVI